jgi:hypothetical protein
MLALSDSGLAYLVIAASRAPIHAPDRLLQRLAEKLDPPPRPPARRARWRRSLRVGGGGSGGYDLKIRAVFPLRVAALGLAADS